MRTSSFALAGAIALTAVFAPARPGHAVDPARPKLRAEASEDYGSGKEALRIGVRSYNAGDKGGAARALEYAADQGYPLAAWKLGRMYAEGDGVEKDPLKAFAFYTRIADENADEAPDSPKASVVSSAFVALGSYFLDGIKNSVSPNPERAAEMFSYAASYFGDSDAQFHLAKLYLSGSGVDRDERQAARWFNLSAEKGNLGAQALLGRMLVEGQGVPRERARGLMWLTLAKQGADPKRDAWIFAMHADAFDASNETDRRSAVASAERFQSRRR